MINRCTNPNVINYHNYGGRGIRIYGGWRYSFRRFRDWALANGYCDDLTIERIDINGDYRSSNCCWIPPGMQGRNTRKTAWVTAWGRPRRQSLGPRMLAARRATGLCGGDSPMCDVAHPR
jgi:hypothetical protein